MSISNLRRLTRHLKCASGESLGVYYCMYMYVCMIVYVNCASGESLEVYYCLYVHVGWFPTPLGELAVYPR